MSCRPWMEHAKECAPPVDDDGYTHHDYCLCGCSAYDEYCRDPSEEENRAYTKFMRDNYGFKEP